MPRIDLQALLLEVGAVQSNDHRIQRSSKDDSDQSSRKLYKRNVDDDDDDDWD